MNNQYHQTAVTMVQNVPDYTTYSYVIYLVITLLTTIWVARTLSKNGKFFLLDAFHGNEKLADSVNHLLVVGFYLINVGYVGRVLRFDTKPTTLSEAIELVSAKIGFILIVLGCMHFFNLFILSRMRKKAIKTQVPTAKPITAATVTA